MPRKPTQQPLASIPPGPHRLEVRVNDKIVFLQRVHSYKIDQGDDQVLVHGALRPVVTPVKESAPEPFVPAEDKELL
jgi:hypothetical protein